jgi:chitinase
MQEILSLFVYVLFALISFNFSFASARSTKVSSFQCPSKSLVAAYVNNWSEKPPQDASFQPLDLAFYFVVETSKTGLDSVDSQVGIAEFPPAAKKAGKKPLLSIGGWTGSVYFSSLVSTSQSRTNFAKTIAATLSKYGYEGVDIDWENVGSEGQPGNIVSQAHDATNFLAFLTVLRQYLGTDSIIHISMPASGITGSNGSPLNDYSSYAKYVNYITLMEYDFYPSGSIAGPNAPLYTCTNDAIGSVSDSVKQWLKSGFPACRILLGVPSYSHSFRTASSSLRTSTYGGKKVTAFQPLASSQPADPETSYSGLISEGILSANGLKGLKGYTRHWCSCTATPFLFNPSTRTLISYDDPSSIGLKAALARKYGLAGINFFDTDGTPVDMYSAGSSGLEQGNYVLLKSAEVARRSRLRT